MSFTLPELKYAFDAMEPHIDAETMKIHHGKHHAAYVTNLNKALEDNKLTDLKTLEAIFTSEQALAIPAIRNNAGGHYNHSFFWETIGVINQKPEGRLLEMINTSFGDLEKFKADFKTKSLSIFGSGWAWLCEKEGKLIIVTMPNQDNPLMNIADKDGKKYNTHGKPILGLDVWEHAYYLKYQNIRANYIDAFFHVINWEKVAEKL